MERQTVYIEPLLILNEDKTISVQYPIIKRKKEPNVEVELKAVNLSRDEIQRRLDAMNQEE